MVIVDKRGRLRDIRNIHFHDAVNLPKEKAKNIRRDAQVKLVKYAVIHGVRYFVVEGLRKQKVISGKVGRWSLREYLSRWKCL